MAKEMRCQHYRQDIDRAQRRLADLETHGIAAMRRDDLAIVYGGRAEEALRTACRLVSNHIVSFTEQLTHFDASLFPEDAPSPQ